MIEVKRTQELKAETDLIGFAFNKALIKEAELWMGAHRDFLASVEGMMTDWLRRQREAFEVSSRSVRKVYDSRNIIDRRRSTSDNSTSPSDLSGTTEARFPHGTVYDRGGCCAGSAGQRAVAGRA